MKSNNNKIKVILFVIINKEKKAFYIIYGIRNNKIINIKDILREQSLINIPELINKCKNIKDVTVDIIYTSLELSMEMEEMEEMEDMQDMEDMEDIEDINEMEDIEDIEDMEDIEDINEMDIVQVESEKSITITKREFIEYIKEGGMELPNRISNYVNNYHYKVGKNIRGYLIDTNVSQTYKSFERIISKLKNKVPDLEEVRSNILVFKYDKKGILKESIYNWEENSVITLFTRLLLYLNNKKNIIVEANNLHRISVVNLLMVYRILLKLTKKTFTEWFINPEKMEIVLRNLENKVINWPSLILSNETIGKSLTFRDINKLMGGSNKLQDYSNWRYIKNDKKYVLKLEEKLVQDKNWTYNGVIKYENIGEYKFRWLSMLKVHKELRMHFINWNASGEWLDIYQKRTKALSEMLIDIKADKGAATYQPNKVGIKNEIYSSDINSMYPFVSTNKNFSYSSTYLLDNKEIEDISLINYERVVRSAYIKEDSRGKRSIYYLKKRPITDTSLVIGWYNENTNYNLGLHKRSSKSITKVFLIMSGANLCSILHNSKLIGGKDFEFYGLYVINWIPEVECNIKKNINILTESEKWDKPISKLLTNYYCGYLRNKNNVFPNNYETHKGLKNPEKALSSIYKQDMVENRLLKGLEIVWNADLYRRSIFVKSLKENRDLELYDSKVDSFTTNKELPKELYGTEMGLLKLENKWDIGCFMGKEGYALATMNGNLLNQQKVGSINLIYRLNEYKDSQTTNYKLLLNFIIKLGKMLKEKDIANSSSSSSSSSSNNKDYWNKFVEFPRKKNKECIENMLKNNNELIIKDSLKEVVLMKQKGLMPRDIKPKLSFEDYEEKAKIFIIDYSRKIINDSREEVYYKDINSEEFIDYMGNYKPEDYREDYNWKDYNWEDHHWEDHHIFRKYWYSSWKGYNLDHIVKKNLLKNVSEKVEWWE